MKRVLLLVLGSALAACGGEGTPVATIPAAPTAPSVPTPTPKNKIPVEPAPPTLPPVTSGTLAEALRTDADFRTGSTEVIWDVNAGTLTSINRPYESTNSIRVYYDKAADIYVVSNVTGAARFNPGSSFNGRETFDYRSISSIEGLRGQHILTTSPDNPLIALTYTSFGVWLFDSADRTTTDPQITDWHFFYFGIPTPLSGMPLTGGAHYAGVAEGVLFEQDLTLDLNGTMQLDADFATGGIGTTMSLATFDRMTGNRSNLPLLSGTASINPATGHFVGKFTTSDNSFVGSVQGAFFGPAANEVGYSFGINSPDLTKIGGGVAVGKQ